MSKASAVRWGMLGACIALVATVVPLCLTQPAASTTPPGPIIVSETGTTGGTGSITATGTGNVNYGQAEACAPSSDGGPFSVGFYPPEDCAQVGRAYSTPTDYFWFSGNQNCANAGRPYSGSQFTWSAQIPETGLWSISVFVPEWTSYNLGAVYDWSFAGGSSTTQVNQQADHGQWVTLTSSISLNAGASYNVVLNTTDTYDTYCHYQAADKVEWTWVGAPGPAPVTVQVSSSNNPAGYGEVVLLTAAVFPVSGSGIPTGTVEFLDGLHTLLGTAPLDSTGQATFITDSLDVGTHAIIVGYLGDTSYASAGGSLDQVINMQGTNMQLISLCNPCNYGTPMNLVVLIFANNGELVPTGSVTIADGTTVLEVAPLQADGSAFYSEIDALTMGSHPITASYGGTANWSSSTALLTETINSTTSNVTLTSSADTSLAGAPLTLTAQPTNSDGILQMVGAITFRDSGLVIGRVPVSSAGNAQLVVSDLAAGTHDIEADYSGNPPSLTGNSSSVLTETVVPATGAITSGSSTTATVGSTFSFPVTTLGATTSKLKKHGKLPRGVHFHNNHDGTATLFGTPTSTKHKSAVGTYPLTITANFGKGKSRVVVTQAFTLTVNP